MYGYHDDTKNSCWAKVQIILLLSQTTLKSYHDDSDLMDYALPRQGACPVST
jgi:hypothetical protein